MKIFSQGELVATKLKDYLNRHPEIECRLLKGNSIKFYTSESSDTFDSSASSFYSEKISSQTINLD